MTPVEAVAGWCLAAMFARLTIPRLVAYLRWLVVLEDPEPHVMADRTQADVRWGACTSYVWFAK